MSGNTKGKMCTSIMGPYKDLKCPKNHHAHHIVPDFALRYGKRNDATSRTAGALSLNEGPSICLPGKSKARKGVKVPSKHVVAHQNTDPLIKGLGENLGKGKTVDGVHFPEGTAPLSEVKEKSIEGVSNAVRECADKIKTLVNDSFDKMDDKTPCRTTKSLPTGKAKTKLSKFMPHNATTRG